LSLVALLLSVRLLPETCRPGSAPPRRWLDWGGLVRALHTPTVGALILIFFLATFAFGGLESTLALVNRLLLTGEVAREMLTTEQVKESSIERKNFLIFAYVGVVLMLVQGGIYRRMVHRVGEVRFMRLGICLMTLGLLGGVLVLLTRDQFDSVTPLILTALAVFTVAVMGFAFLTPSVQALISRRSDPTRQGEVLGVNQSASALARILGPFLSITLFFATPSHILPYTFGAALLAVVFFLSLRVPLDPSVPGERMPRHAEAQADSPG
jgi:MFS family permease